MKTTHEAIEITPIGDTPVRSCDGGTIDTRDALYITVRAITRAGQDDDGHNLFLIIDRNHLLVTAGLAAMLHCWTDRTGARVEDFLRNDRNRHHRAAVKRADAAEALAFIRSHLSEKK